MSQPGTPNAIILAIKGLVLNPSTFDPQAANGSLTMANNVVIDRPSVVATRRGMSNMFASKTDTGVTNPPTPITLAHDGALSMYQYNNRLLVNTSDSDLHKITYAAGTGIPSISTFSGKYPVPAPTNPESRVRGLETNKNFYFITEQGTYRLDDIDGEPRLAGSPPGLSGTAVTSGTPGFFPDQTNIAYRVVFGYKDANDQLVLGAPSSRIVTSNTTGTSANVSVTFQVPKEIQSAPSNFFFQVYRSTPSPDLTTEPSDEMALTYEDICVGSPTITITDITPDSLLGASLYTNQGQDGILQSNYRPPWALDICTFKQYAFYANTRTVMNANLTLISAGALNGADALVPGDTITFTPSEFGGTPFTLLAVTGSNNTSLGWFQVSNTGNPAYDIQVTASNIALVANAFADNEFLAAYYTSTTTELPGRLRFDRLSLIADNFVITSNRSACWEQPLTNDPTTTTLTSINDSKPNRIYYSKFNQPEAVPVVNYLDVGSANAPIRRIVPLRDGVMVLKDDGVFRLSNAAPPFTVTPIDLNVRILAANTADALDNKVYFLSDQGIVALSDSDSMIKSFVLDRTIIENTSPDLYPNLSKVAWGIAYQSDRKYILFMPKTGTDVQATQQYVYNHLTEVWTRWTLESTCGVVFKRDGKLYLGSAMGSANSDGDSYIYQERKSFTLSDYADNQYITTTTDSGQVTSLTFTTPTLPTGILIEPGWTIQQTSSGSSARIATVTMGDPFTTVTLDKSQVWEAGELILYTPIQCEVQTIQLDCENPAMNKQFSEIVYVFTEQGFSTLTARIASDTAGIPIADTLTPVKRGGWGIDPWGISPWGGTTLAQGKIRRYVPQAVQRAGWLYLNLSNAECFTSFGWSGIELWFKNTSTRQK